MACVMLGLALLIGKTNSVWAANAPPNPDFVDPQPVQKPPTEEQKALTQSIDIAPEPAGAARAARQLGYFHHYRNGLAALVFGGLDSKGVSDGTTPFVSRLSLQYLFSTETLHQLEASADLQSDNSGALGLSYRWILERDRFRPYTKLGAAMRIDPADQFAALLRLENVQIRGSAGFERTLRGPTSFRMDAELLLSGRTIETLAGAGLVWAW